MFYFRKLPLTYCLHLHPKYGGSIVLRNVTTSLEGVIIHNTTTCTLNLLQCYTIKMVFHYDPVYCA
jgi:hypothetical protein